jgi:superfamily II DNA or RNA helicase
MSRKLEISKLTDQDLELLSKELLVSKEPSRYAFNTRPEYIYLYETDGDDLYIPFSYSNKYSRPSRNELAEIKVEFTGNLRENQKEVKNEAMSRLNSHGSVIIAAACGFGKTSTAIYIASKIKLKTLILCHRVVLVNQWKDSIHKFCPDAKVQILSGNSKKEDADFYIMNAINVSKRSREQYDDIGFLIVDEAHLIMADKLSSCMRYIVPRYVLGLSATPYRTDGLDILLDMYFGKYKITRKLFRKHTVYRINTGLKPEVKLNRMGKVDWGSVLESQCSNIKRNELIIGLVKYFKDRTFLLLCKRVDQAIYLYSRLQEEKEDVTSLIGSKQDYEQSSRILVGTVQKTGVGFDHPKLNTLVLCSDVEQYFVQYLGRVFRREDTDPIIFDLVDNYSLLLKHFKTRNSVYVEHGGIVKDFYKEFPR